MKVSGASIETIYYPQTNNMIKLTAIQARAVAEKIRQKIAVQNATNREAAKKEFKESKEYEAQRQVIYELLVHIHQASLKIGEVLGIRMPSCYSMDLYKEEEISEYTNNIMERLANRYAEKNAEKIMCPSIDTIVTDLIFDSLLCEDLQSLMDNYISKCYENKSCDN